MNREPSQIELSWSLTLACNYRCAYCWHDGNWSSMARNYPNVPSAGQWMDCWDRLADRYGNLEIEVVGGEPMIFPEFSRLMGSMTRKHDVGVTTNLSVSERMLRDLGSRVNPERFRLSGSFHPHFSDFDRFFAKLLAMREFGIYMSMNLVAYPEFIDDLPRYIERCGQEDVKCTVWVFTGRYNGRNYPEAYTEKERTALKSLLPESRQTYNLERAETMGKLCHAGRLYASVQPDGSVSRCGTLLADISMGNIFDPAFELFESPRPCPVRNCVCSGYRFLDEEFRRARSPREIFTGAA